MTPEELKKKELLSLKSRKEIDENWDRVAGMSFDVEMWEHITKICPEGYDPPDAHFDLPMHDPANAFLFEIK